MGKLKNAKHERFCQEYIIDLNATQAYIRVGYSEKGAETASSRLLTNVKVQQRIAELKGKVGEKLEVKQEDVARELMRLGYSNVKSFINEDGSIKNIHDLPDEITAAVSSVKHKIIKTLTDGSKVFDLEIKFHSKERALDSLGKHVGFFEKHNEQKKPIISLTPEQQLERIEDLKKRIQKTKDRE